MLHACFSMHIVQLGVQHLRPSPLAPYDHPSPQAPARWCPGWPLDISHRSILGFVEHLAVRHRCIWIHLVSMTGCWIANTGLKRIENCTWLKHIQTLHSKSTKYLKKVGTPMVLLCNKRAGVRKLKQLSKVDASVYLFALIVWLVKTPRCLL